MDHNNPVPQDTEDFAVFVSNLNSKLNGPAGSPQAALAVTLNLPAVDIAVLGNIHNMLAGMLNVVEQIQQRTRDVNAFWRWFLRGPVDPAGPQTQSFPAPLTWFSPPISVIGGAISWVGRLVTRLKKQTTCTSQIRQDLGLDGAAQTPEDPQTWKPVLTCSFTAGHPVLGWPRKRGAKLEIQRLTANGWVLADVDDRPDWMDPAALPPPGTAEVRTYRAIYRLNGAQVGQWSDVCEVPVKG